MWSTLYNHTQKRYGTKKPRKKQASKKKKEKLVKNSPISKKGTDDTLCLRGN